MMKFFECEQRVDFKGSNQSIKDLKKILGRKNKAFLGSRMEDASEFLTLLLSELEESVESLGLAEENFVRRMFSYKMEESLICSNERCRKINIYKRSENTMWCHVNDKSKNVSVQDLVNNNGLPVELDRKCMICKSEKAYKQSKMTSLPNIMIIILKRQNFDKCTGKSNKSKNKVIITPTISLDNLVKNSVRPPHDLQLSPSEERSETPSPVSKRKRLTDAGIAEAKYKLTSVVSHIGTGDKSGHYLADVFRYDTESWFRYSDEKVTSTNEEAVTSGNVCDGYILTYIHSPLRNKLVK